MNLEFEQLLNDVQRLGEMLESPKHLSIGLNPDPKMRYSDGCGNTTSGKYCLSLIDTTNHDDIEEGLRVLKEKLLARVTKRLVLINNGLLHLSHHENS